jgi:peptidoglycan-N-acetylglucosamine deacetylase
VANIAKLPELLRVTVGMSGVPLYRQNPRRGSQTDIDTFDFKLRRPEDVVKSAMKLAKNGKGILLMHDFQHATAEALPELLRQLKAGGYKIVHMVPKEPVTTLAKYDEMVRAQDKYSTSNNARSESSVVKTISE